MAWGISLRRGLAASALAGALLVPASAAIAATPDTPVPAATYVTSVCGTASTLADQIEANANALVPAANAFKASPSAATAAQFKAAFTSALQATIARGRDAVAAWEVAGYPEVKGGREFALTLLDTTRRSVTALEAFTNQVGQLDVSDPTTFARNLQELTRQSDRTDATLRRSAKRTIAVKRAAPVLRPLVTYVTTDAERCGIGKLS